MLYMVIESFKPGAESQIYERANKLGRMLPAGLKYIDSWLAEDGKRCFQLMETTDPTLFEPWLQAWHDLVEFEVVPVQTSPLNK